MRIEEIKALDYTYEIGQIASILANPDYTMEKVLEYQAKTLEDIEFEKNHGIDTAHNVRNNRIWNAVIALMKLQFTL